MPEIIAGQELIKRLAELVGLSQDAPLRRIIIDAGWDNVPYVYVEMLGTESLLRLEVPDVEGAHVMVVSPEGIEQPERSAGNGNVRG